MKLHIKIGTRGSKLALWQAHDIEKQLQEAGASTEIIIIETKGDKVLDRSLSKIGSKGVFTEELEDQLRDGRIDIAVHSAKDVPSDLGDEFELIAFTKREKVNDVLVSRKPPINPADGRPLLVGTSSTRRVAMLSAYFPHMQPVDIRGNLETRLRKLDNGDCDALLLAYAGVHRMGYDKIITYQFDVRHFTPAVGQGSIAVESTKNLNEATKAFIKAACNHVPTERQLLAERAYLKGMNGGCSIPVFGLASDTEFMAGIIRLDGSAVVRETLDFDDDADPVALGQEMADRVLSYGGHEILMQIKRGMNA